MQRRVFLRDGALALLTIGLSPSFLRRTVFAQSLPQGQKGKVLVCLFQRGAADALNMVVPFGERAYYALRPTIAIPAPGRGDGPRGVDLDGFFALHPSLAPLVPLYKRGILAPIQAVGSPSSTRSHFDAQDYMESGTPDVKSTHDGWLNRLLAVRGTCEACAPSPFRAVSMTPQMPRMLEGPEPVIAMSSLGEFSVRTSGASVDRLEALYRSGSTDLVHGAGRDMFEAVRMLRAADPSRYAAAPGADYPRSPFALHLKEIAQLIKANVGLEVAFADVGGWDTHVNQGGASGALAARLDDFSRSLAAFVTDLGDRMEDVVIVTMSEFGRMARQNGTGGTDHGHAGAMFVIGGSVRGGKVLGRWPGLQPEQLYEGRDLALTTDFRSVFAEVVSRHMGAATLDRIFPGFAGEPSGWLGIL
ncbi:MAG: hypothetical protein MNPFHGCM_01844 [Gemmatimonadaceae bacterium]|nr:hypothetical protein [Gemmatimonadaceae bacterium]